MQATPHVLLEVSNLPGCLTLFSLSKVIKNIIGFFLLGSGGGGVCFGGGVGGFVLVGFFGVFGCFFFNTEIKIVLFPCVTEFPYS